MIDVNVSNASHKQSSWHRTGIFIIAFILKPPAGRYLVAARNFQAGDIVFQSTAFAYAINAADKHGMHRAIACALCRLLHLRFCIYLPSERCHGCLQKTAAQALLRCAACKAASYCSKACQAREVNLGMPGIESCAWRNVLIKALRLRLMVVEACAQTGVRGSGSVAAVVRTSMGRGTAPAARDSIGQQKGKSVSEWQICGFTIIPGGRQREKMDPESRACP